MRPKVIVLLRSGIDDDLDLFDIELYGKIAALIQLASERPRIKNKKAQVR